MEYAAIEVTAELMLRSDKLKVLDYWREKQGGDCWLVYDGDEARWQKGVRIIDWKRVREIGEDGMEGGEKGAGMVIQPLAAMSFGFDSGGDSLCAD